jgi:hypothetical protein
LPAQIIIFWQDDQPGMLLILASFPSATMIGSTKAANHSGALKS